ncbi:unnamed protein product [Heterosigma akashiwo]
MFKLIVLAAVLVAVANASCPNLCSGHGSCGNDDMCTCYVGWGNGDEDQGDCSQRICPFERAWVDSPSASNVAHALAECAGRGICNRESGECECFDGYTGQGCQRTTCPNDCSGHGTCEYIEELRTDWGDSYKLTGEADTTDQFEHSLEYLWDMGKTMGCACDAKWTDVDCSRRQCPRSNYALFSDMTTVPEIQRIRLTNVTRTGGEFALLFRSRIGEEFVTNKLDAFWLANNSLHLEAVSGAISDNDYNGTETDVQTALESLPNYVLAGVEVSMNFSYADDYNYGLVGDGLGSQKDAINWFDIYVTFSGDQTTGDQYLLECKTDYCGAGCFPVLDTPVNKGEGTCEVLQVQAATSSNMECSGRGKCNYDSGICECFEGYTDDACGTQTALI